MLLCNPSSRFFHNLLRYICSVILSPYIRLKFCLERIRLTKIVPKSKVWIPDSKFYFPTIEYKLFCFLITWDYTYSYIFNWKLRSRWKVQYFDHIHEDSNQDAHFDTDDETGNQSDKKRYQINFWKCENPKVKTLDIFERVTIKYVKSGPFGDKKFQTI